MLSFTPVRVSQGDEECLRRLNIFRGSWEVQPFKTPSAVEAFSEPQSPSFEPAVVQRVRSYSGCINFIMC